MNDSTRKHVEEQIEAGFECLSLPLYMKEGVRLYVFNGIIPGSFLRSVLENNLTESFSNADSNNLERIAEWAEFLIWNIPSECWGSREKVVKWANHNGLKGVI